MIKEEQDLQKKYQLIFQALVQIHNHSFPRGGQRGIHDCVHSVSTAFWSIVLLGFYKQNRKYTEEIETLEKDLGPLLIAAGMHDSGRCGEGVDEWETESGQLTALLLETSGYNKEGVVIKDYQDAVACKDPDKAYFDGKAVRHLSDPSQAPKPIQDDTGQKIKVYRLKTFKFCSLVQQIIHDADTIELLRIENYRKAYRSQNLAFIDRFDKQEVNSLLREFDRFIQFNRKSDQIKEINEANNNPLKILEDRASSIPETHTEPLFPRISNALAEILSNKGKGKFQEISIDNPPTAANIRFTHDKEEPNKVVSKWALHKETQEEVV